MLRIIAARRVDFLRRHAARDVAHLLVDVVRNHQDSKSPTEAPRGANSIRTGGKPGSHQVRNEGLKADRAQRKMTPHQPAEPLIPLIRG